MSVQRPTSSVVYGDGPWECLHFVGQIWQRACRLQDPESATTVARDLGISVYSAKILACICRHLGKAPSQKRLCLCVLNDPDRSDAEVAELFGRSEEWVAHCRANADEIREREQFPLHLEWFDEGLTSSDPSPNQIIQGTKFLRSLWVDGVQGSYASVPKETVGRPKKRRLERLALES